MRQRQRPWVGAQVRATLRAQWALLAVGVVLRSPAVYAGDLATALDLDIPPQDLGTALSLLASRADLQILVSQELIAGKSSPRLRGHFSGLQALQRMLVGADLDYSVTGHDTVVVRARTPVPPPPTPAAKPAPSKIRASATSQGGGGPLLEEIVVTAQKRLERLQDVPLTVTALGARELSDRQIGDTGSLVQMVPALNYQQGNNPTNSTLRIRGVGTALFGQGTESSVSLVVDGVVLARQVQSFSELGELERVEILEGPQGTLFGKNATGGVINVITALPSHTSAGSAEATIAAGNEYRIQGTTTGPLSDTFSYRVSGYYNKAGGWIHDIATGTEYGGSRSYGLRGKLSWDPTEELNLLLAAEYRDAYRNCCHPFPIRLVNPILVALYRPLAVTPDNISNEENAHSDSASQQITTSLTAIYTLGFAELTSIAAFQSFHLHSNIDVDGLNTPQPIFVGLQTPNYGQYDVNGGSVDLSNFTEEVRLSSTNGRRLTYVEGLYYSILSLDRPFQLERAICSSGILGQPCPDPIYQSAASSSHLVSSSIAAFGQAEYALAGDLKLIGGLREQRDAISVRGRTVTPNRLGDVAYPGYTGLSGEVSDSNTATSGKGGLQYAFSRNSQAYLTYTRGYKGLGFNTEITADWAHQPPILPETVNAYELGYKGRLFEGQLVIAADAFLARYENLQVQANHSNFTTGTYNFVPTNAGSSRSRGLELQMTFRPTTRFSLSAGILYNEATFSMNGLNCPLESQGTASVIALGDPTPANRCYNPQVRDASGAIVNSGPIQDVRGGNLPASPRWRAMVSSRYEQHSVVGSLDGFVQLDLTAQSRVQMALEQDPLLIQSAYTLTHLTVGLRPADQRYQISFFVKNVFNQRYFTTLVHGSDLAGIANPYDVFGWRPKDASRYVGAALDVKF